MSCHPLLSPPDRATIYLVDDDLSFLRAASRLLRLSEFRVVVHNDAEELLSDLQKGEPGCIVADLNMPGTNGLELQERLKAADTSLPIIFLTAQGDIPTSVKAMRGGAEDFLTKDSPKEELFAAVNRAVARNRAQLNEREQMSKKLAPFEKLSDRELEVLRLVVRGYLNKQIAHELGIGERTVKLHRTAVTHKLGVPSVAELTTLCLAAGGIEAITAQLRPSI